MMTTAENVVRIEAEALHGDLGMVMRGDLDHATSRRLLLKLKSGSFRPVPDLRLRPAESLADALLGAGWRGIPLQVWPVLVGA